LKTNYLFLILSRFLRRSFAAQAFITCSRKGNWRGAHKADKVKVTSKYFKKQGRLILGRVFLK
jgi:hypothetical protein